MTSSTAFLCSIFCLVLVSVTKCANILALFPFPGKSHYVMFEPLLKNLADRGHNVDVVTHFSNTHNNLQSNYHEISIKGSLKNFTNNVSVNTYESLTYYEVLHLITAEAGVKFCETVLKTEALINLKNTTKKYDLVITEIFGSDCMLGFGYLFKIPTISLVSSVSLPWANDRIGNPDNPAYIPNYFLDSGIKLSFWERIKNTVYLLTTKYLYKVWTRESNKICRDFFGPLIPDLEDLARNTSLVLVNSHFSMNGARPAVPNFIEVGGLHIKPPQKLDAYFENLLSSDLRSGIIYLTMGSMVLTESFAPDKLQEIFNAFGELDYKILWKATRHKFPGYLTIPDNIHFEPWMPQMDILCHPNVKLFVSHGGLMGSQEAIYCAVPRLGIPLFSDQDSNIRVAEKMGWAIRLDYGEISKTAVLRACEKLLNDSWYKRNVEKAARLFKDRPVPALDLATYWVEYVIRHRGAPELRSAGADLFWFQYYLLDAAFFALFIIVSAVYTGLSVLNYITQNRTKLKVM